MSLFACTKCSAVENTACTSGYHGHKCRAEPIPVLCSECADGKWHGLFPKRLLSETNYQVMPDGTLAPPGGWPRPGSPA